MKKIKKMFLGLGSTMALLPTKILATDIHMSTMYGSPSDVATQRVYGTLFKILMFVWIPIIVVVVGSIGLFIYLGIKKKKK